MLSSDSESLRFMMTCEYVCARPSDIAKLDVHAL